MLLESCSCAKRLKASILEGIVLSMRFIERQTSEPLFEVQKT